MDDISDKKTLDEFKSSNSQQIDSLKESGEPTLLTIDGEPAIVVQDAKAYDNLRRKADFLDTAKAIRKGMAAHENGEGLDLFDELEKLAERDGFSLLSN